ncbi:MAG TPA: voltage-gated Cl-channel protein, partial [Nitrospina sp.]|nr:voltage-gated Cl-channel protein [Nitrospina sp.]|tara:strand:+ start:860 stop:2614 length:1755 start_codon:yes stop_codon:yes gene_type:complete
MSAVTEQVREKFRNVLMFDQNMLILAALLGFLAGFASTFFRWMIEFFGSVFSVKGFSMTGIPPQMYPFLLPLMPMVGGCFIGLICKFFPNAVKENGVHKVMYAVALNDGKVRKRTITSCAVTSSITIGSGGSAGREGPTVQIGAAVGSTLGQWLHLSTERVRVLVGCGAAAGIAASFNAPLAGVLFALEIVLGDFTIHTFSPIIIASVIGTVTGRALEGNEVTFDVPVHELVHPTEIIFYLALGMLCGAVARLFTFIYFYAQQIFEEKINIPDYFKPALGGFIVGMISIFLPQILGNGYDYMEQALTGQMFWGLAFLLVFMKIMCTSITLGSGGMGGVFAPSLFIGAMLGTAFGSTIHGVFPTLTASAETYSVVGMGAVAGAVMQAPLTNILMLFELTNDYTLILPIMVSCIASSYTYQRFTKHSIYVQYLLNKGINIRHGREVSIMNSIKVRDVMNTEFTTIAQEMPFRKILETISYSKNFYFPVLDNKGDMTGILSFSDIREMMFEEQLGDLLVAGELATHKVLALTPEQNLNEAMELFTQLDVDQLPVVRHDDKVKVIGMITRGDVMASYNREILVTGFER